MLFAKRFLLRRDFSKLQMMIEPRSGHTFSAGKKNNYTARERELYGLYPLKQDYLAGLASVACSLIDPNGLI